MAAAAAAAERRSLLVSILICLLSVSSVARGERSVIQVEGGPDSVVWVVQLSDLHFSVFRPERALDFKRLIPPALSMINPSLVLITGDLTDGKSKDLLTMKLDETEWIEYQNVIEEVAEKSRIDKKIFYDLRGNHDCFGVPEIGGKYDYYRKHSTNAKLGRNADVQSITLQNREWTHLFVGFDSSMEIGLRGPTNLFGHPTDQLLEDIDAELSQWDDEKTKSAITKITFGHFPLSFSAATNTGKSLKDVFLKHSLSAYICGHLHTRFGQNLKRHHQSSGEHYQLNIHQGALTEMDSMNCSNSQSNKEFWEWEMGDWRKSRAMRILAIDSGHVSFLDVDFRLGLKKTVILPTFPVDSRFMQRISSPHMYKCQTMTTSIYDTVRALVFSRSVIASVTVKIYDSRPGNLNLVLDSAMKKIEGNETRGDMYVIPWNWRAFVDPSPERYWLQIEAVDVSGSTSYSQLRPFSINGLTSKVNWKWKEFYVMGCQWDSLYYPILWSVLLLCFSMLLIPQAYLICSRKNYTYKSTCCSFIKRIIGVVIWVLTELSRMRAVWWMILLYLIYLISFPWFAGYVFIESEKLAYMTYRGWVVASSNKTRDHSYIGVPDVMVIVLPHLCLVVTPSILTIALMAAEKTAYRTHYLSLSGKKKDDHYSEGKRLVKGSSFYRSLDFFSARWGRKILLLVCLSIMWNHLKKCRALVKAYEMNVLLHSPIYCFSVPILLAYAIYKTGRT